jgi:hypothetical protein
MKKIFGIMACTICLISIMVLLFTGCTDNQRMKAYGGTATIELLAGQKLVNVTWKDTDIWVLTRQARPGEQPETYTFQEKSSYGIINGTYLIKESLPFNLSDAHIDPGSATSANSYMTITHQIDLKNAGDMIKLNIDPGNQNIKLHI